MAVDERGAREERALVASYLRHWVTVLLLDQREEQLQEVASLVGTLLLSLSTTSDLVGSPAV